MRNEQWAIKLNEILIFAYSMVSIESLVEVFSAELELETESRISHFIPIYFPFFPIFYLGKPSSWFEPMTCLLLANVIRIRPVCCMIHCAKRVQIRTFLVRTSAYLDWIRGNTEQKNSVFRLFSCSNFWQDKDPVLVMIAFSPNKSEIRSKASSDKARFQIIFSKF